MSLVAAVHGREPTDEEVQTIESAVDAKWSEYRHGIEVSDD